MVQLQGSCETEAIQSLLSVIGPNYAKLLTYPIFSQMQLELFNMYRVYMGEFKIAMRTLASYEAENPQFKEILNLLQQSPLCERLSLASYLLTPIQRLPRYELLLKVSPTPPPLRHARNRCTVITNTFQ